MTFREREDIEAYRAINAAHFAAMDRVREGHQGRRHPRDGRLPIPFRAYTARNGYIVTSIRIKSPLVAPVGHRAKYAHFPRYGWIAWRRGKPVKMQVRFLCGGYSWTARGVTVEENHLPVCVKCRITATGQESVIACLDRIEKKK